MEAIAENLVEGIRSFKADCKVFYNGDNIGGESVSLISMSVPAGKRWCFAVNVNDDAYFFTDTNAAFTQTVSESDLYGHVTTYTVTHFVTAWDGNVSLIQQRSSTARSWHVTAVGMIF